jgi:RimJ/RimL family protein N-acetyltransferase
MIKVEIRPLKFEDASTSYLWRNDPEVWKLTGNRPTKFITKEIEENWIRSKLNESNSLRFAIIANDEYVGNIQLTNIISNQDAEYHIFIGNKIFWNKGVAQKATHLLISYIKEKTNINEIYLFVNPDNKSAIKVYEKTGFIKVNEKIEMRLKVQNYDNLPLVSIFMITYNHELFIKDALDSILNQRCNYTFEIVVGEDFSTDNTRKILNEYSTNYPNIFHLLLHDKNIGAINNQIETYKVCRGKYVALCEGDDYWTDPFKLQKQIDFLEAYENCNYIFSNFTKLSPEGSLVQSNFKLPEQFDLYFLLKENIMPPTQTVVFRNNLKSDLKKWNSILTTGFNGDWILLFMIAENSRIGFLKDNTAVYREGVGVVSKTNNAYKFLNGLETNKKINKLTHFKYDYHIGNYDFHYQNITYSFLEYKQKIKGLLWFCKSQFYKISNSKSDSFFSKSNWIFIKHSFKLLLK